jgi:hypothetical protein
MKRDRPPMRVVMEAIGGCTVDGSWRAPGDVFELPATANRLEEARRLVRARLAIPANFASYELLGDCRAPKRRAAEPQFTDPSPDPS